MTNKTLKLRLDVETLTDKHDCETCGSSYADGGIVSINGEEFLRKIPHAHCFDGDDFSIEQIILEALQLLGVEIYVDGIKANYKGEQKC